MAVTTGIDGFDAAQRREGPGARERFRLIAFEACAGLFHWLGRGAGLAAQVLAVLAVLGDGSWWNVLYAAIAALLALWLRHEFRASHGRAVQVILDPRSAHRNSWAWTQNF